MTIEEKQAKFYALADGVLETAKKVLATAVAKGADYVHVALPLHSRDGEVGAIQIYPLPGDKEARGVALNLIAKAHPNMEALIIISDSWATPVPQGKTVEEAIEMKEKGLLTPREGLTMLVCGDGIVPRTTWAYYTRVGKKVTFEASEHTTSFESWMIPKQWAIPMAQEA